MIVYQATKQSFHHDILTHRIEKIVANELLKKTGKHVGDAEVRSWKESLGYMSNVLLDNDIPNDVGIAIEYHIPQTTKRIDFILTGQNEHNIDHAILVELKQWSSAKLSDRDGVVYTYVGGGERDMSHPSYQAWSYAALLEGFNETVYQENVQLKPCAYLHNYEEDEVIRSDFYQEYLDKAPAFLAGDDETEKLRDFIKRYVKRGDVSNIMYRIECGRIRPSKALVDSLVSMLDGNDEFVLVDDQKTVFEEARSLVLNASDDNKKVLIVEGGPGTGKTLVAVNLLVKATAENLVALYVTKNAAPRAVYESLLTKSPRKSVYTSLFSGSGAFTQSKENEFDVLIVDEAHRLNEKSGMYKNLGENQVKEIITAAKCSIFFIDEDQRVTWGDIGTKEEIIKWARQCGAEVVEKNLSSQFRCNGSDGYLAWLDDVLQVRETANYTLEEGQYDFQVFSDPNELRRAIQLNNVDRNKSRLVAGYCWEWATKSGKAEYDVVLPEYDFKMKWNLASDGSLWIVGKNSVNEVGCIHTCQGLELDYVGVIIGDDFVVRDGEVVTNPSARARSDKSLSGYVKASKDSPEESSQKADLIIKNTYRTLMTRGMKGCYVYCTDKETEDYFRERLTQVAHLSGSEIEGFEDELEIA